MTLTIRPTLAPFSPPVILRALTPVAFDFMLYKGCRLFSSPAKAFAASTLAGTISVILFCARTKVDFGMASFFFLAYKTAHFFYTHLTIIVEEKLLPTLVVDLFEELKNQMDFSFNSSSNDLAILVQEIQKHPDFSEAVLRPKLRAFWNRPDIELRAYKLVMGAAAEMYKLWYDVSCAIGEREDKDKAIAALITTDPFAERFIGKNKNTLFQIYWYIRCMRYRVNCSEKRVIMTLPPTEQDNIFPDGSTKAKCQEIYNKVVILYTRLLPHLPASYAEWIVKDEGMIPRQFLSK